MKGQHLLAIAALAFYSACGDSVSNKQAPSPTPTPESPDVHTAKLEHKFESDSDSKGEIRAQARHAAMDYIKTKLPMWNLKGLSSELYSDNTFWIVADIEEGKRNFVAVFSVRKFFPEQGEPYWKVIPLRNTMEDLQHALKDEQLLRELGATKAELEDKELEEEGRQ
jgi:hypothetical protein